MVDRNDGASGAKALAGVPDLRGAFAANAPRGVSAVTQEYEQFASIDLSQGMVAMHARPGK